MTDLPDKLEAILYYPLMLVTFALVSIGMLIVTTIALIHIPTLTIGLTLLAILLVYRDAASN